MCSPLLSLSSNKSVTVKADSSDVVFKKVSSAISDYRGTFLLVNENSSVAFNSSLSDINVANNSVSVTISNNQIVNPSSSVTAAAVTFEKREINNNYYYFIKLGNGNYLTYTDIKRVDQNANPTTNAVLFDVDGYSLKMSKTNVATLGGNTFRYTSNKFQFSNLEYTNSVVSLYKYEFSSSSSDYMTHVFPYINSMSNFKSKCSTGITESNWNAANSVTSSFTADVFGYLGNMTYVHNSETSGSLKDYIDLYDYIISKYGYTDYLKRKGSSAYQDNYNHSKVVPLVGDNNDTNNGIWLSVIVTSIVVISLTTFLVIKKYRKD